MSKLDYKNNYLNKNLSIKCKYRGEIHFLLEFLV